MLQKLFEHTCFVAKTIYTHFFCHKNYLCTFLSQKEFMHTFFVAKTIYMLFLSRKRFTHFVRKVFARWKMPSGKFRFFGPLGPSTENRCTVTLSRVGWVASNIGFKWVDISHLIKNFKYSSPPMQVHVSKNLKYTTTI